jgi:hypothetical protein
MVIAMENHGDIAESAQVQTQNFVNLRTGFLDPPTPPVLTGTTSCQLNEHAPPVLYSATPGPDITGGVSAGLALGALAYFTRHVVGKIRRWFRSQDDSE